MTVYVPAAPYVCTGFCWPEMRPSPKFQPHEVGLPVELSAKLTVRPLAWNANSAFGGVPAETATTCEVPDEPEAFVAVNDTVRLPATGCAWRGCCCADV